MSLLETFLTQTTTQGLSLVYELPTRLGWLSSELQGSAHLSLLRTGMTRVCHRTQLLCGCWHLNSSPHTLKTEASPHAHQLPSYLYSIKVYRHSRGMPFLRYSQLKKKWEHHAKVLGKNKRQLHQLAHLRTFSSPEQHYGKFLPTSRLSNSAWSSVRDRVTEIKI